MDKLKLGLIVGIREKASIEPFQKVSALGIPTCQTSILADEAVRNIDLLKVRKYADEAGVEISCVFMGFSGQIYNFKDGPRTMGLVAPGFQKERLRYAKELSDMVKEMGINYMGGHIGFIPDDERDPVYQSFLPVMKEFLEQCEKNGQTFCFETGQELPSTLKRTFLDLGMKNVGVNLDPANLIMYGKANPLDAVEIFGQYVKGMHGKDGLWPTERDFLGKEVPIGEGMVPFPLLMRKLKAAGYNRPVTIEREISGVRQIEDIKKSMELLDPLL